MDSYPVTPFLDYPASLPRRRAMRPTALGWLRHGALLFVTFLTTTFGGIAFIYAPDLQPNLAEPTSWLGWIPYFFKFYALTVAGLVQLALNDHAILAQGLTFSLSLLAILIAHEAGHYVACRIYGVDATLPFFIPSPPLLGPGTFGAFIKIVSPIPSRRALFDIGVAGPLAGFVVVIPVAIVAMMTAPIVSGVIPAGDGLTLSDPLLFRLMALPFHRDLTHTALNAYWFAAWIGLLVTSLNLLPVGQLDGAHAVMAVFGRGVHRWAGRFAFVTMVTLAILGFVLHGSPGGFLYAILLAIMLRVPHSVPDDLTPLGTGRLVVAGITLAVFALCFWPFPVAFR